MDILTAVTIRRVRTCGSHPAVLSVFEPAETAGQGQGQGPLAIKEPLQAGWWFLIPRGLNIYWETLGVQSNMTHTANLKRKPATKQTY